MDKYNNLPEGYEVDIVDLGIIGYRENPEAAKKFLAVSQELPPNKAQEIFLNIMQIEGSNFDQRDIGKPDLTYEAEESVRKP